VNAQDLIAAIQAHAWPLVAALVIGFLVRIGKDDVSSLPTIPKRFRPLVALGLGLVSGACDAIVRGTPWKQALGMGLVSSFLAMGGHDVIIEAIRGGKEVGAKPDDSERDTEPPGPPPSMPPTGLVTAAFCLALVGCGVPEQMIATVKDARDVIVIAEPCLVKEAEREQRECLDSYLSDDTKAGECMAARQAAWEHVWALLDGVKKAWCTVSAGSEGCEK
jgi:hypothetical protein